MADQKVGRFKPVFKALRNMVFPSGSTALHPHFSAHGHFIDTGMHDLSDHELHHEVGDGTSSNALMAVIGWVQRTLTESHLAVMNDDGELDDEHDVLDLLRRPNEFYDWQDLLDGIALSLLLDGNAYLLKVRNGNGRLAELWYVPHHLIEPKWPSGGKEFVTHYEYQPGSRLMRLELDDVIHFRRGVDPHNVRKGLSALKALLREVWTDQEAAMYTSSLLKNGGVPGLIVSPDKDMSHGLSDAEANATRDRIDQKTTRSQRGRTIVMKGPTKVEQFGYSPQQLDLSPLRNVNEERIAAMFGVPAAVVGFGSGLQQTKVGATMKELRQAGWRDGVKPLQSKIATKLSHDLGPEFGDVTITFDNRDVSALKEDEKEKVERVTSLVNAGLWTRAEGRRATGQEATPADEVFLMPFNVIAVSREEDITDVTQGGGDGPVDGGEIGTRSALLPDYSERKDNHTLTEQRIAANAPRRDAPPQLRSIADQLDAVKTTAEGPFREELLEFFDQLGRDAEAATLAVLTEQRASGDGLEVKQNPDVDTERIIAGLAMADRLPIFQRMFERQFLRVAKEVGTILEPALGVGLTDPVERAIVATGGTRAGLFDLTGKTRAALFDALTETTAEGLGADETARRIRDKVPRGRWSTATIRARVIARTESAFAANTSSVETMKGAGVERAMVMDARAGDTDATCEALDGRVVTVDEARQLTADEHPNGTRSFTPVTEQLAREMEV